MSMPIRSLSVVLTASWFMAGCPRPAPAPPNQLTLSSSDASARVDLTVRPLALSIVDAQGNPLLSTLSGGGAAGTPYVGVAATQDAWVEDAQLLPGWDGYRAGELPWQTADATLVEHSGAHARLRLPLTHGTAELLVRVDGPRVRVELTTDQPGVRDLDRFNKVSIPFALPAEEHFLGLGERYATYDHRGWSLYSWAEEAGVGAGEGVPPGPDNPGPHGPSMTYFPVPFFHSTRGYSLWVDTTARSELHLGSERPDAWRLAVNHNQVALTVYADADPLRRLDLFTEDTGRPMVPAPWVWGNRRRINRGAMVDGVPEWQRMRDLRMPITGVDDAMHFLPASRQLGIEAELRTWADTLHANGFKLMGYYNPYVAASDSGGFPDFQYGRERGWFIKGPDGEPALTFFISGTGLEIASIDLTQPDAANWFKDILKRSLALGYDGWMHDFGEYTARNTTVADGRTGELIHNLYPVLSAKAAFEMLSEERPDDFLFFVRSGYTGSQAWIPAVWSGDPEASFDGTQGLPSMLRGGLNLALSGVPYWGADAQGYKCLNTGVDRNRELFYRWLQASAVSPIMMEQDRCFALTREEEKWLLWDDEETPRQYARYASLHTRLQPLFRVLALEAHQHGWPVMRPLFLTHPTEPSTWTQDDVFFLGDTLLTAPVVQRGVVARTFWAPAGVYVDVWDGTVHQGGGMMTVPAPEDRLPLLLAENRVLPLLDPAVQTLAPATVPGVVSAADVADRLDLQVVLRPGGAARVVLADGAVVELTRATATVGANGFAPVAAEALADCTRCTMSDNWGGTQRLRFNTDTDGRATSTVEDVTLVVTGGPLRRYRVEAWRVP